MTGRIPIRCEQLITGIPAGMEMCQSNSHGNENWNENDLSDQKRSDFIAFVSLLTPGREEWD